jgi:hypothetical protein
VLLALRVAELTAAMRGLAETKDVAISSRSRGRA